MCCALLFCIVVVQEKIVEETHVKVHKAQASGKEALASALQSHVKELQELQGQVEIAQQQRCISEEKCQKLKEEVEELVPFKEKAQVRKNLNIRIVCLIIVEHLYIPLVDVGVNQLLTQKQPETLKQKK